MAALSAAHDVGPDACEVVTRWLVVGCGVIGRGVDGRWVAIRVGACVTGALRGRAFAGPGRVGGRAGAADLTASCGAAIGASAIFVC